MIRRRKLFHVVVTFPKAETSINVAVFHKTRTHSSNSKDKQIIVYQIFGLNALLSYQRLSIFLIVVHDTLLGKKMFCPLM